ncbi:hypothetical protein RB595_010548 [Gaeumannomyces hyphopodioides]
MSRWHTSGCNGGDENMHVNPNGLPHCQICKSSPDVPQLLSQLVAGSPGLEIPPDEPPGLLNLSWPPTIAYSRLTPPDDTAGSASRNPDTHALPKAGAGASAAVDNGAQLVLTVVKGGEDSSPLYAKALGLDEFRLLVLDSRDTPTPSDETAHDRPVHVSLETCRDSEHPEYETVSYTWGGEEDDSSPSQPVYVGPYWDALFQTKNCHDMLRHLRPSRGIRFLWVDAICINQNDPNERAQQVAKMRTIYSNAWRVVVYLGSDLITPIPTSSYPTKKRVEELRTSDQGKQLLFPDLSLQDVLERRYFSRIWVVQELLLSRQVCIRIRDIELIIDRSTQPNPLGGGQSGKGSGSPGWNATKAPWMAHAAQGTVADPIALLQTVGLSKASDPRDNAFGTMGLLHPPLLSVPDYSLSLVRTRVGFAAHVLLNGNAPEVILHPGPRHMGQHPSWVPWPSAPDLVWRRHTPELDKAWESILKIHYSPGEAWTIKLLHEYHHDAQYASDDLTHIVPLRHGWRTGAHIEELSGSLSIQLVHLMPIKSTPFQIHRADGFRMMRLEALDKCVWNGGGRWEFCLVFQDSPHDPDLVPGEDHIFMLYATSRNVGPQFMILRQVLGRPLAFRLVACCHRIFVCHRGLGNPGNDINIAGLRRYLIRFLKSTELPIMMDNSSQKPDLYTRAVRWACLIYHGHKMSPAFPLDALPGRRRDSTVLCALVAALNMFDLDLAPRIVNFRGVDCIELHLSNSSNRVHHVRQVLGQIFSPATQPPSRITTRSGSIISVPTPKVRFWRRGDTWMLNRKPPKIYTRIPGNKKSEVAQILNDMITSPTDNMSSVYVLLPVLENVKIYIRGSKEPELETLERIGQDKRLDVGETREDSLTVAVKWIKALSYPCGPWFSQEPLVWETDTDPDHLLAAPNWPRGLVEAFSIDGSTYQVTII